MVDNAACNENAIYIYMCVVYEAPLLRKLEGLHTTAILIKLLNSFEREMYAGIWTAHVGEELSSVYITRENPLAVRTQKSGEILYYLSYSF